MNRPGPVAESLRPGSAVDREPHTGLGGRQGASDRGRWQTGGLRPGLVANRGPQIRPGGRQGALDRARWQAGGLRLGPAAEGEGGSRSGPGVGRKRGVCHLCICVYDYVITYVQ